jgi:hypothetical protein
MWNVTALLSLSFVLCQAAWDALLFVHRKEKANEKAGVCYSDPE